MRIIVQLEGVFEEKKGAPFSIPNRHNQRACVSENAASASDETPFSLLGVCPAYRVGICSQWRAVGLVMRCLRAARRGR
jgi:hypothetical protein